MPDSVSNASPTTVLPKFVCAQFSHSRQYALQENEYRNGESQRSLQVASSRKSWALSARHTPAALATLRAFVEARRGSLEPFYFYDLMEGDPIGSNYDPTGGNAVGRYAVRLVEGWSEESRIGRSSVALQLVEIN